MKKKPGGVFNPKNRKAARSGKGKPKAAWLKKSKANSKKKRNG